MATASVILPVVAGISPDGSGTGNNPATPEKVISSGAQTSNTPKLSYYHLLFDQSTDEHWMWSFRLPSDYASGGAVVLTWGAKVTTGNVIWKTGINSIDPSAEDADAAVFNAADLSSATAVPGTTEHLKETSISLTVTGLAAGELVILFVGRDADNGSDTAAGDATLAAVTFTYTTV